MAGALLLLISGCTPVLTRFWVASEVARGSVFEIVLSGTSPPGSGAAGCVVQLPDGFEVEGWTAWGVDSPAPAPTLLATYTAEAGHHLVAYRGDRTTITNAPDGGLRLFVRAPDVVGGPFPIQAALAGQASGATTWSATDPVGVTDFAAMSPARPPTTCSSRTAPSDSAACRRSLRSCTRSSQPSSSTS